MRCTLIETMNKTSKTNLISITVRLLVNSLIILQSFHRHPLEGVGVTWRHQYGRSNSQFDVERVKWDKWRCHNSLTDSLNSQSQPGGLRRALCISWSDGMREDGGTGDMLMPSAVRSLRWTYPRVTATRRTATVLWYFNSLLYQRRHSFILTIAMAYNVCFLRLTHASSNCGPRPNYLLAVI